MDKIFGFFEKYEGNIFKFMVALFATSWVVSRQKHDTWWKNLLSIVAGALGTSIVSPSLIGYLAINGKYAEYSLVFLTGILFSNTVNTVIDYTPTLVKEILANIGTSISNLFNKKT